MCCACCCTFYVDINSASILSYYKRCPVSVPVKMERCSYPVPCAQASCHARGVSVAVTVWAAVIRLLPSLWQAHIFRHVGDSSPDFPSCEFSFSANVCLSWTWTWSCHAPPYRHPRPFHWLVDNFSTHTAGVVVPEGLCHRNFEL